MAVDKTHNQPAVSAGLFFPCFANWCPLLVVHNLPYVNMNLDAMFSLSFDIEIEFLLFLCVDLECYTWILQKCGIFILFSEAEIEFLAATEYLD